MKSVQGSSTDKTRESLQQFLECNQPFLINISIKWWQSGVKKLKEGNTVKHMELDQPNEKSHQQDEQPAQRMLKLSYWYKGLCMLLGGEIAPRNLRSTWSAATKG
jgi:hypothetical protein